MPTTLLSNPRSLRVWALVAIGTIVLSSILSAAFDEPGDGNDPFLAELGNYAVLIGVALLLGVAIAAVVRAARRRT